MKFNILQKTDSILKFRITVYLFSLIHLVIMMTRLLNMDFEKSDDVNLQQYAKLKWALITAWFNLLTTPYLPLCIYCDFRALKDGCETQRTKVFNQVRSFLFTTLILPVTIFSDIQFWRLYYLDRRLLMPLSVDNFITMWDQHSMHSASLVFVLFDFLMVYRERPKNLLPGILTLLAFLTIYIFTCVACLINGLYVYPCLKTFSAFKMGVLTLYFYISHLFYYTGQWALVDFVYGQKKKPTKLVQ